MIIVMVMLLISAGSAWAQCNCVIKATDYGVIANDDKDDGAAIVRAVNAAHESGGGTVRLPSGKINLSRAQISDVKHVVLEGESGATVLVRKRFKSPDRERLMTLSRTEHFTLRNLSVDMNRMQQWGGIGVYASKYFTLDRVHIYDSSPYPYVNTPDRYAIVFGFGGLANFHEHITIRNSRIEDLQLEIDHARGILVEGNWLINGDFTAAVGSFGLGSGYIFEDARIIGNRIVNASRQAITIQMDFRPPKVVTDVTFRNIVISDNIILYNSQVRQAPNLGIRIGMHDNSLSTPGTRFENITVERNSFYIAPQIPHSNGAIIFGNMSGLSKWKFEQLIVRDNMLYYDRPRKLVEVRRVPGDTVEISNNVQLPYSVPPAAPFPAINAPN